MQECTCQYRHTVVFELHWYCSLTLQDVITPTRHIHYIQDTMSKNTAAPSDQQLLETEMQFKLRADSNSPQCCITLLCCNGKSKKVWRGAGGIKDEKTP